MTLMTFRQLAESFIQDGKYGEEILTRSMRLLGIELLRNLVLATPVWTGRARANWQLTVNIPAEEGFLGNNLVPGEPLFSAKDIAARKKYFGKMIHDRQSEAPATMGLVQFKDIVYLVNNMDYVALLNDGLSVQAPAKFVEATFDKVTTSGLKKILTRVMKNG